MRWPESTWFKNLCLVVAGVFFSTSITPMALGFAPPKSRHGTFVPSPVSLVPHLPALTPRPLISSLPSQDILKPSTGTQVSKLIEAAQQKIKDLELLQELESRVKTQQEEATSCRVPDDGPMGLQKDALFPLSSSSNGKQEGLHVTSESSASVENFNPHLNLLPGRRKGQSKRENEKHEQGEENWLEQLGHLLGSLFISEAHAQEPPPGPLDSTPDANTTDHFIIDKATELTAGATTPQEKAQAIFNFVRDEISYESYRGSLRGSRGTLWSNAGNALDQASLLIALLRASGIPAQYAQGTITDPLAQDLILSMFHNPTRVVGCPTPDVPRADPTNAPQLLTETREHYWVELDMGGGFIAADPTFNTTQNIAQLEQSFATTVSTFTEIPDSLRHTVTIRLNTEFFNSFLQKVEDPQTVLAQTFYTVELVGHPRCARGLCATYDRLGW